jgi:hypothetical protein
MAVRIGDESSSFDEPLELLSDCHRRIERFLAALIAVARDNSGSALNPEQERALQVALRYFRRARMRSPWGISTTTENWTSPLPMAGATA